MKDLIGAIICFLIAGLLVCVAYIAYSAPGPGTYSRTIFYNDVYVSNYSAMANVGGYATDGGHYTNGAFTNFYRVNATNSRGRLPISSVATVTGAGATNTNNAVVVTWNRADGIRRYVVEYSSDNVNWTQWVEVSSAPYSTTNWTDIGTTVWNTTTFTDEYAVIAAPVVPWSYGSDTTDNVARAGVNVVSGRVDDIEFRTGVWNQAAIDATYSTNWIGTNIFASLNVTDTVARAAAESNSVRLTGFETRTQTWNQAATDASYSTNWIVTNGIYGRLDTAELDIDDLESRTGAWDQAGIDATYSTNWIVTNGIYTRLDAAEIDIDDIESRTQDWNTAIVDSAYSTNWIATNGIYSRIDQIAATQTLYTSETDALKAGAITNNQEAAVTFLGDVIVPATPANTNSATSRQYVDNKLSRSVTYYFQLSEDSDVADCYVMDPVPSGGAETNITLSSVTQDQYVVCFMTPSNTPAITEVQSGVYEAHMHLAKDGVGSVEVKAELYVVDALGNTIFEVDDTSSVALTEDNVDYDFQLVLTTNAIVDVTSRWAVKIKVTSVGVPAPDVLVYAEGASEGFLQGNVGSSDEVDPVWVAASNLYLQAVSITNLVASQVLPLSNRVDDIETRTSVWNTASADATYSTNWIYTNGIYIRLDGAELDIDDMESRTQVWNQASSDASNATNFIATNGLAARLDTAESAVTNKVSKSGDTISGAGLEFINMPSYTSPTIKSGDGEIYPLIISAQSSLEGSVGNPNNATNCLVLFTPNDGTYDNRAYFVGGDALMYLASGPITGSDGASYIQLVGKNAPGASIEGKISYVAGTNSTHLFLVKTGASTTDDILQVGPDGILARQNDYIATMTDSNSVSVKGYVESKVGDVENRITDNLISTYYYNGIKTIEHGAGWVSVISASYIAPTTGTYFIQTDSSYNNQYYSTSPFFATNRVTTNGIIHGIEMGIDTLVHDWWIPESQPNFHMYMTEGSTNTISLDYFITTAGKSNAVINPTITIQLTGD